MSGARTGCAIALLLLVSCAETDQAGNQSVEELIAVLRSPHWRAREKATEELIARGKDEVVLALLTELDQTADARVRDRIKKVLHGWGIFALGTRVVGTLAKLANWNRQLMEDIVSIRSDADQSSKQISDRLMERFGMVVHTLRMETDKEVVSFRKELITTTQRARLMLTQKRKSDAIAIVAELSRLVTATVDGHGDLDQDGMSTSWEFAHGLDPILDDSAGDPDGDGRSNIDEFSRGSDPHLKD